MKRKGYVMSLFVFTAFLAVFLLAATTLKSVSLVQESDYERVSIMKAARVAHNLEYLMEALYRDGINCSEVQGDIEGTQFPFKVKLDCYADVEDMVAVNLVNCRYIYGFRTDECGCDPVVNCVGRACGSDGCGGSCGPGCGHDEVCVNGLCQAATAACGPADLNSPYPHTGLTDTFNAAQLCSSGTPSPTSLTLGADGGERLDWQCIAPSDTRDCSAERLHPAVVHGACGTAHTGSPYLYTGSSNTFSGTQLCSSGTSSDSPVILPPAIGSSETWTCQGSGGGFDSSHCIARRVQCIENLHCTGTNQVCNANNQCVCRSDFSDCNNDGNCDCNTGAGNQCRNGECCIRVKGTGSFNANPPERGTGLTFEFAMVGGDRYLVRNDQNSINQRCKEVTVGSRDYVKGYFISASTWCGSYSNACYKHWTGTTWQSVCCRANPGPEVVGWAWCCK
jgi:hypothetical protein